MAPAERGEGDRRSIEGACDPKRARCASKCGDRGAAAAVGDFVGDVDDAVRDDDDGRSERGVAGAGVGDALSDGGVARADVDDGRSDGGARVAAAGDGVYVRSVRDSNARDQVVAD